MQSNMIDNEYYQRMLADQEFIEYHRYNLILQYYGTIHNKDMIVLLLFLYSVYIIRAYFLY